MTRRTLVPATVVALLASLALAPQASACTCAPRESGSEADALAGSDGAVVVRLSEIIDRDPHDLREKHVYRLLRIYKGPASLHRRETLTLKTNSDESACGLGDGPRRKGLYLYGGAGRWTSSLCSQTTPENMRRAASEAGSRVRSDGANGCR